MPEPTTDPKQPEKKQESQPVTVDASALGESISRGLAKELGPILSRPAQRDESAVNPPTPPPTPLPKEPSYDEIMEAIESGDKRKAADLMSQRDRAREVRLDRDVIDPLRQQGAAAISQMAQEIGQRYLTKLPQKFRAEVEHEIRDVQSRGVMVQAGHWEAAVNLVYGRHAKEIEDEAVETRLRQARENPAGLEPGQGGTGNETPEETSTLAEEFPGRFHEAFTQKKRAKGGLTEDAEVQALNRGIKGARAVNADGKPIRDYTVKDYLKERRAMQAYLDENPSLGLDE